MVIFHSYVKLPEGTSAAHRWNLISPIPCLEIAIWPSLGAGDVGIFRQVRLLFPWIIDGYPWIMTAFCLGIPDSIIVLACFGEIRRIWTWKKCQSWTSQPGLMNRGFASNGLKSHFYIISVLQWWKWHKKHIFGPSSRKQNINCNPTYTIAGFLWTFISSKVFQRKIMGLYAQKIASIWHFFPEYSISVKASMPEFLRQWIWQFLGWNFITCLKLPPMSMQTSLKVP